MSIVGEPALRYTLCFLTREDRVLMLRRRRAPNQGLWNGVGGKIEGGETPSAACLRGFEAPDGALCVFTAQAPDGEPAPCNEGDLAWMARDEVLCSPQVVSNIHRFGPEVFAGLPPRWHRFGYRNGVMESYDAAPIGAFSGLVDCL